MYFIKIHKKPEYLGCETHLALSDDLLHWIYEAMTLGHKYVNVYNGKAKERIFLAVFGDGETLTRYLDIPIIDETGIDENPLITCDLQITKSVTFMLCSVSGTTKRA